MPFVFQLIVAVPDVVDAAIDVIACGAKATVEKVRSLEVAKFPEAPAEETLK